MLKEKNKKEYNSDDNLTISMSSYNLYKTTTDLLSDNFSD